MSGDHLFMRIACSNLIGRAPLIWLLKESEREERGDFSFTLPGVNNIKDYNYRQFSVKFLSSLWASNYTVGHGLAAAVFLLMDPSFVASK